MLSWWEKQQILWSLPPEQRIEALLYQSRVRDAERAARLEAKQHARQKRRAELGWLILTGSCWFWGQRFVELTWPWGPFILVWLGSVWLLWRWHRKIMTAQAGSVLRLRDLVLADALLIRRILARIRR